MKLKLIPAALVMLTFVACKNKPTTKDHTSDELLEMAGKAPGMNAGSGRFTVKTPTGWTRMDTVISRIQYAYFVAPPEEGNPFQANVNIITQQLQAGFTLQQYVATTEKEMSTLIQGFKKQEEGERTIAGEKARWIKYRFVHHETEMTLNGEIIILVKDNIAYAITLTTPKDALDKYSKELEELLHSFQA
ncbi:DUF1795 domain-containing protein [Chitinophaga nivalis]|uniref:DUF1795 domain-containing protein n=1 Tax=Chitinophaga nivalis TaxID=2991709 RepID=A0ABT3ILC2_9BACT|nr:DUF1795 domain-containing protein [Chitinophaga nivalis]MCW3465538.1 DUF1795 domain-containing protein [Chitinophaga nivalis]MCW3484771.1 DUF1795 domain-containing protein [Chitinophaga nivalis]